MEFTLVPRPLFYLLILGALSWAPSSAWAHALGAECSLKDGNVRVEAFFNDDSPAVNAKVQILDAHEKTVATGQTDVHGLWSFAAPSAGRYMVIVDAGAGHRAKVAMTVPDTVAANQEPISDGSTRNEFTSFPYLKMSAGLGSIFLVSLALLFVKKKNRTP